MNRRDFLSLVPASFLVPYIKPKITKPKVIKRKKSAHEFADFSKKYFKIVHPAKGLIPFEPHDFQLDLVQAYEDYQFNIVKKFRCGGITTTSLLWSLWKGLIEPGTKVCCIENNRGYALCIQDSVFDPVIFNLPKEIKYEAKREGFRKFENGSEFHFMGEEEALEKARGHKFDMLIFDEAAFFKKMEKTWKILYPCVAHGGKVIVPSTVNGLGNWFFETYYDAVKGRNKFHIVNLHYWQHPDYNNKEWAAQMRKDLGEKGWHQEILAEFVVEE